MILGDPNSWFGTIQNRDFGDPKSWFGRSKIMILRVQNRDFEGQIGSSGWSFQTPKTAFSGTFQVSADLGRPCLDRLHYRLELERLDHSHYLNRLNSDLQIWDRGHSFVDSRGGKIWPTQNREVPKMSLFWFRNHRLPRLESTQKMTNFWKLGSRKRDFSLNEKISLRISLRR